MVHKSHIEKTPTEQGQAMESQEPLLENFLVDENNRLFLESKLVELDATVGMHNNLVQIDQRKAFMMYTLPQHNQQPTLKEVGEELGRGVEWTRQAKVQVSFRLRRIFSNINTRSEVREQKEIIEDVLNQLPHGVDFITMLYLLKDRKLTRQKR